VSVKVLEDGTRVYSNRTTYTPIPPEQRKKISRKPDTPGAFRFRGDWLMPLPLIPEEQRSLPETLPDTVAYDHAWKRECRCVVCRRPQAKAWRLKWRRQMRRESSAIS
jgi:hypothetical protein